MYKGAVSGVGRPKRKATTAVCYTHKKNRVLPPKKTCSDRGSQTIVTRTGGQVFSTAAGADDDDNLFIWEEYLNKCRAKAVPAANFKHVHVSASADSFAPGMKLEARDRSSPDNNYWVATVVMASGPLLLLRFDGDDDRSGDFWCDARSEDLQPVGFCAESNNVLVPPEAIRYKKTNWVKFLIEDLNNAIKAPNHLFHKTSDEDSKYQLKASLKLEVVDKADPLTYWIATVVEAYGLRLNLQYEGSRSQAGVIWAYFLSDNVHQLGWGASKNLTLKPPESVVNSAPEQDWVSLTNRLVHLVENSSPHQGLNKFYNKTEHPPDVHGFMQGMKLEAVHPQDPSSICVATVKQLVNERYFLVELDNYMTNSNQKKMVMCCHSASRNIFPVGWCDLHGIQLTPPPGYQKVWPFRWDTYLEFSKATAAPDVLFNQSVPDHEFEVGLKLEAVDQTNPSVVTVATVTQVVGRTVWLQLDGYHDDYVEHIYDVESHELFPCGWCSSNGHPLRTPRKKIVPTARPSRLSTLRTRDPNGKALREKPGSTNSDAAPKSTGLRNNGKKAAQGRRKLHQGKRVGAGVKVKKEPRVGIKTELHKRSVGRPRRTPPTMAVKGIMRAVETNQERRSEVGGSREEESNKGAEGGETTETSSEAEEAQTKLGAGAADAGQLGEAGHNGTGQTETDKATTGDGDQAAPTTIDLTEDSDGEAEAEAAPGDAPAAAQVTPPNKSVTIHVKHSCALGPLVDRDKFQAIPAVIGPLEPSAALRMLVEQIVLSSVNSRDVLRLLAEQKAKMNVARILKALAETLSSCENLFSLNRVLKCACCDGKHHAPVGGAQGHATWERKHISQWTVQEAVDFVRSAGYAKYAKNFQEQEVDGRALMLFTLEDIHQCLGVPLGPAVIIHDEVQQLRESPR